MASIDQTDKSREPLRDANSEIDSYICNDIGNSPKDKNEPKSVIVSIPPPSKFQSGQQPQQPINTVVANLRKMNGQREPISVSDTNVSRSPPEVSSLIGQNSSPTLDDRTTKDAGSNDDVGEYDTGDDAEDEDIAVDESKALEARETKQEKKERQRLPSERLKEESSAERRARRRQDLMRMMSPGKPKEYKLCSVVAILFMAIFVMFILVLTLCPKPQYGIYHLPGTSGEQMTVNGRTLDFHIRVDDETVFSGKFWRSKTGTRLPHDCTNRTSNDTSLCLRWVDTQKLDVTHTVDTSLGNNLSCFTVAWEALQEDVWQMDCFDFGGKKWFGGGLLQSGAWIIDGISLPRVPFLTGSIHKPGSLGPILERYWLTSEGIAVIMDDEMPLHVSINSLLNSEQNKTDEALCLYSDFESDLSAMYRESRRNVGSSTNKFTGGGKRLHGSLKYSICRASSIQEVHAILSKRSVSENPDDRPELPTFYRNLMKAPVWSTQQYIKPGQLNQTNLLEFADMVTSKKYGHSMLFVDRGWEQTSGDLTYDAEKFYDSKKMNEELKSKGFLVTVSVSPTISWKSGAFHTALSQEALVRDIGGKVPSLVTLGDTSRDDENIMATVDVTSDSASKFLTDNINRFLNTHSVDSIYLTGSDVMSLPAAPTFETKLTNLDEFTHYACRRFSNIGKHISTFHSAYKCQNFPVFIRLGESTSTWNQSGGLSNVIASALALNQIGYPYIIPDPVGGEFGDQDGNRFASRELYIRWLQVAIFFPVMHLSVPPHHYGNSTELIARELLALRQSVVLPELQRVLNESISNHEPPQFLRPLWWLAQNSSDPAFSIEDEFLVGDNILVAPILHHGQTLRNIYLTKGLWEDTLNNVERIHMGPKWLMNYTVPLRRVPYFIRKDVFKDRLL